MALNRSGLGSSRGKNVNYSCAETMADHCAGPPRLEDQTMTDHVCPLAFVAAAAFASGLVWVFALMAQLSLP